MTLKFEDCAPLLSRGRGGRKKLANNTYLHQIDDTTFGVKLHDTFVVKVHQNGTFTLDSGGWQTSTTKSRINDYAPVRLYQSRGLWYLSDKQLYEDGCVVDAKGALVNSNVAMPSITADAGFVQSIRNQIDSLYNIPVEREYYVANIQHMRVKGGQIKPRRRIFSL